MAAVVEMKRRNRTWGCPRIAQQVALAFGIPINKHLVRRILATKYRPEPDAVGPSWLTVLGHAKDSLWSLDLFRSESAVLRTHWVLVVMNQYTRRIVGFGVQHGVVDVQRFYNGHRTHAGLKGGTPEPSRTADCARASVHSYRWQLHCRGLYQTPMAA